jgi:ribonuclease E
MPNKMLIDATHPEETRVVVLRGNRVEEFDFESANRKQLRGNIYLAKVTRVEPSLQAAFVDYGGNRHGFLAFSEIHPDYYQIPVADRQALIDEEERAQRAADAEADNRARRSERGRAARRPHEQVQSTPIEPLDDISTMAAGSESMAPAAGSGEPMDTAASRAAAAGESAEPQSEPEDHDIKADAEAPAGADSEALPEGSVAARASDIAEPSSAEPEAPHVESPGTAAGDEPPETGALTETSDAAAAGSGDIAESGSQNGEAGSNITEVSGNGASSGEDEVIESVGGADAMEEVPERTYRSRRQYKIQEVIKRRQVMLVQVVKEERGTKGAALTTYLSLAGRYSVLMPNTARGGGISRKITSAEDRRRLKEIAAELEVPEGMGVILRTAGASRTKTEVKRDFEYLLRLWETVRDLTLKSTAPMLVYEEGSLVKRSIRDLYNKDIDEILVAGDVGYQEAKDFMRMLMPSHAKNVRPYRDALPVFTRFAIESQLDAMFQPVVQLRSGGYIVINQAEALVAIDVNSGRATREHHIEDTALKTNLEAAEEVARQLRLRDLAGLIVIDFIDMDEKRNNRSVERRLKECLKHDRARIQVGHISHFGLLEMSRQRIRSSVLESSTDKCPHCGGTGHVRSVSSVALQLLRALEEMLLKGATHNLIVRTRTEIALYLLNHKRAHLRALEERFQVAIMVNADPTVAGQLSYIIDKGEQVHSLEQARAIAIQPTAVAPGEDEAVEVEPGEKDEADATDEDEIAAESGTAAEATAGDGVRMNGDGNGRRKRRRRRGRRGTEGREVHETATDAQEAGGEEVGAQGEQNAASAPGNDGEMAEAALQTDGLAGVMQDDAERRRRRRGRRGGRRRRGRDGSSPADPDANGTAEFDLESTAPTAQPADPVEQFTEPSEPEAREESFVPQPQEAQPQDAPQHEPLDQVPPPAFEPSAPTEPTPARRRSTVRERAPVSLSAEVEAATPAVEEAPQPVVSSSNPSEEESRPRRSGWWSRRVLGKG